jgi:hypothetical protein
MNDDRKRRRREPKRDGKKDPHSHDLFVRLVGKKVHVDMYDDMSVTGKLDYVARYEIQVTTSVDGQNDVISIIPKHAILRASATKES